MLKVSHWKVVQRRFVDCLYPHVSQDLAALEEEEEDLQLLLLAE